ncbi:MAG: hypothetical protein CME88_07680 [Hirschia sp.]|nr:hypothetical protein [Hirschia sp.]MBF18239.1 hypothetical protein [Hirschia sp.]|tara:strand:- start:490 stop:984 length:495 start_codon:yes stop_codon:yes gene_type:complete
MTDNRDTLALIGQQTLLNEWIVHAEGGAPAYREDMQPAQFLTELAFISIIEQSNDDLYFRLAGTEIRRVLGVEARGRCIEEIDRLSRRSFSVKTVLRALSSGRPLYGQRDVNVDDIHCWLRLPLLNDAGEISFVLCHDRVVNADKLAKGIAEDEVAGSDYSHAA